jgi:hypothetical protein
MMLMSAAKDVIRKQDSLLESRSTRQKTRVATIIDYQSVSTVTEVIHGHVQ